MTSEGFRTQFGAAPQVRAAAPGRVNLIGEHTDYNEGFVLPAAIPQETEVEMGARAGDAVRAWSAGVPIEAARGGFTLGAERASGSWIDYVAGVTWTLRRAGFRVPGFDVAVRSGVPIGAGLSSSAALEIALLRGLRSLFLLPLDDVELARLGQAVENDFVGAHVGIMDQMAVSLAGARRALFLDTRSLTYELVPLPESLELVVIHSGVEHSHRGGSYNLRRRQCERAAALLGVPFLRDLPPERGREIGSLPDPERRRARHVIEENARVIEAVEAMKRQDGEALGRLFDASHASLRDDFEVTIPETDALAEILRRQEGVLGARMTGGGFGGSVVALALGGGGRGAATGAASAYARRTGRSPTVIVPPD